MAKHILFKLLVVFLSLPAMLWAEQLDAVLPEKATTPEALRRDAVKNTLNRTEQEFSEPAAASEAEEPNSAAASSEAEKTWWSKFGFDQKFLGFHGYLETRNYYDIRRDNDKEFYHEVRNNLRLSKEFDLTSSLKGKASLDGSLFLFKNKKDGFETEERRMELWECFFDYFADTFDIRLGQQIIRWGKSDEVNPTDVFTPEDLSEFFNNIQRAQRKLPIFATKLQYYVNNYTLETAWLPFFKKTRLDETEGDWEAFIFRSYRNLGLRFLDDDGPPATVKNSSAAIKLTREGENSDISLSYSYHYSETPALVVNPLLETVDYLYPRQHTIGTDFETVIGRVGLRGELAYTTETPFVSYSPTVASNSVLRDTLNYVVGADYTFANNLYTNLQYTQQYIVDYPDDLSTQRLEDSIVWRVTKDFRHETITLKTTGRYYLSAKDAVVECSILYKINDNLHLTAGFYKFAGDEDTNLFGQYNENDQVYSRLKYFF